MKIMFFYFFIQVNFFLTVVDNNQPNAVTGNKWMEEILSE